MSELRVLNVIVEGDKSGFNSKNAVDKFKQAVKSSDSFDLSELTKKYVKSGFVLEQVEKTDNSYKFMIGEENSTKQEPEVSTKQEPEVPQLSEKEQKRQMLKAKINLMHQDRTNSVYHKAKTNNNVSSEILNEYMKLKQISKMPVPEPNEIFAHPEEYKPIISMVLQNSMMKQLGSTHPYVRYFKLIAEKLGVEMPLPFPTQNFLSENKSLDQVVENKPLDLDVENKPFDSVVENKSLDLDVENKPFDSVVEIKGNEMSKGDETDSEDEVLV